MSGRSSRLKALIIGGGIGGLTTAIALEQAGIEAHVYERVAALREVGAGISLWANAVRALSVLGVADLLPAHGWSAIRTELRTSSGTLLVPAVADDEPHRTIMMGALHRADLLSLLMNAARAAHVHPSCECTALASDGSGVTVRFADGTCATGDLLIGADGLRSVVRQTLFETAKPKYAGYTAWRSVAAFDPPAVGSETWGCGQRFGIVPLTDGRVYWYATKNVPEGESEPAGAVKASLLRLFRGWLAPIEALLNATPESAILRNDIYDLDPMPSWTAGRVALLGDAAHAMTPNLGQGACQAIEDAVVLAACVAAAPEVETGLQRYQARRIARTRMILLLSRRLGQLAQWERPLACRIRNLAVRATPLWVHERQLKSVMSEPILADHEHALFRN